MDQWSDNCIYFFQTTHTHTHTREVKWCYYWPSSDLNRVEHRPKLTISATPCWWAVKTEKEKWKIWPLMSAPGDNFVCIWVQMRQPGDWLVGLVPDAEYFGLLDAEQRRFNLWLVYLLWGGKPSAVDVWVQLLKLNTEKEKSGLTFCNHMKKITTFFSHLLQFLASFLLT